MEISNTLNGKMLFYWEPKTVFNPFYVTGLFLYPLEISENLWFSEVFKWGMGHIKWTDGDSIWWLFPSNGKINYLTFSKWDCKNFPEESMYGTPFHVFSVNYVKNISLPFSQNTTWRIIRILSNIYDVACLQKFVLQINWLVSIWWEHWSLKG